MEDHHVLEAEALTRRRLVAGDLLLGEAGIGLELQQGGPSRLGPGEAGAFDQPANFPADLGGEMS